MDLDYTMGAGTSGTITSELLDRWRAHMGAIPLPSHLAPRGGTPLASVADDAILNCPPHMIAHIQRTASQGGLQVVSPRQTPMTAMMQRRTGEHRMLGDHDVGSTAPPAAKWPTLFGDDDEIEALLPDEPLPAPKAEHIIREKTRTIGLVRGDVELCDPVLNCLVRGRGVIDILSRPDVGGGADEMAQLLAEAWGIAVSDIMDLGAYTLGVDGPLQRHAMKVDDVYPTIYAPVHVRQCITAGVSELSKDLLHEDLAIDWRRCRVFCEAVFYNSVQLEGIPMRELYSQISPADPTSRANAPGTLTFLPAPAIAWTYAPETFALMPVPRRSRGRRAVIPEDVRRALQNYVDCVRPVSYLLTAGKRADVWQTATHEIEPPSGETVASHYGKMVRSMTVGPARGKTSSATLRSAIYNAIEGAPPYVQLRISRYFDIALTEVKTHLKLDIVPDRVIVNLAHRLKDVGSTIHHALASEANRRGATLEDWWEDAVAQVPTRIRGLKIGTFGWTVVGLWLLFREPTEKWHKLRKAVSFNAFRTTQKAAIGSMPLPAKKGSGDRLVAAARHAAKAVSSAYMGYYQGVADVANAIAEVLELQNNRTRTAQILREGGRLWALRAKCLRAANVSELAHDEDEPKISHYTIDAEPVSLVLKPAPYMAWNSWKAHVEESTIIGRPIKMAVMNFEGAQISSFFSGLTRPIFPCVDSVITRYLNDPARLGDDMERGWQEMVGDLKVVAERIREEIAETAPAKRAKVTHTPAVDMSHMIDVTPYEAMDTGLMSYWTALGTFEPEQMEVVESRMASLPEGIQMTIMEGHYADEMALLDALIDAEEVHVAEVGTVKETVR